MTSAESSGQINAEHTKEELQEYTDRVIDVIGELRDEMGIEPSSGISVYLTNTSLVRSMLEIHGSYLARNAGAVDIVPINVDAGIPMPKKLAQRTIDFGRRDVTVAISEDKHRA